MAAKGIYCPSDDLCKYAIVWLSAFCWSYAATQVWIDFLGGEVWVRANLNGFKRLEYPVCFGDPKFGSVSRFQLPANNSPGATQCDSGVKVHANANMWVVCNLDASRLSWSPTIPWLHVAVSQWISACHRISATVSFQWLRLEWGNMLQDVARHAAVCCSTGLDFACLVILHLKGSRLHRYTLCDLLRFSDMHFTKQSFKET